MAVTEKPKILIVGGVDSLVNGNFGRKLNLAGTEVGWHVDMSAARLGDIPQAAQGIVVIKDMCSHALSNVAKAQAKDLGIPCAQVNRKWSDAEPILRAVGILPPATNGHIRRNTSKFTLEQTFQYIQGERDAGRNPKKAEVEAVLQRIFGPRFRLGGKVYKSAMRRACEVVPVLGAVLEDPSPFYAEELEDAVKTILECTPERATCTQALLSELPGLTAAPFTEAVVEGHIKRVLATWKTGDRQRRDKAIFGWLLTMMKDIEKGKRAYSHTGIKVEGKTIFGVQPPWELMKLARLQVFPWADKIVPWVEAMAQARKLLSQIALDDLLKERGLKSFGKGPDKYTSKAAIQQFLTGVTYDPALSAAPMAAPSVLTEDTMSINKQLEDIKATLVSMSGNIKGLGELHRRNADNTHVLLHLIKDMREEMKRATVDSAHDLQDALLEAMAQSTQVVQDTVTMTLQNTREAFIEAVSVTSKSIRETVVTQANRVCTEMELGASKAATEINQVHTQIARIEAFPAPSPAPSSDALVEMLRSGQFRMILEPLAPKGL